eukprot:CAMPEP_0197577410 /NCGR_PEP_ID=MMETSP1326-20131121/2049_1 /TAXON_ID=1155430 /ORGANISM="Genus nov. species nov., Strain RCC2288" /LENGTH=154 /DNA_ID=CAMNT_0043140479 /DNA_START=43 /DNA_END=507 /DNA_ORIENTATION=-
MALVASFQGLAVGASSGASAAGISFKKAVSAFSMPTFGRSSGSSSRGVFQVFAKQNKEARTLQAVEERMYNKQRKSQITTRMKKVFVKAMALKAMAAVADTDILDLEKLISEATKAVDKAVAKGVLHKNTGARRKSRMSKYKQELRREKGLLVA